MSLKDDRSLVNQRYYDATGNMIALGMPATDVWVAIMADMIRRFDDDTIQAEVSRRLELELTRFRRRAKRNLKKHLTASG